MTRDDRLLRVVAHVRLEQSPSDSRWERLAAGTLSKEDEAELCALAAADPEAAAMYEAFRPVSRATKDAVFEHALASLRVAKPRPASAAGRISGLRRLAVIAIPVAVAAAVALFVRANLPPPMATATAAVPDYRLSVTGGDRVDRLAMTDEPPVVVMQRDSSLEFVVRPVKPAEGDVAVRAFLVESGRGAAWKVPMARSKDGAARVVGTARELLGSGPGTWDVVFAIGRADEVPEDPAAIARAFSGGAAGLSYQLLAKRVQVVAPP